MEFFFLLWLQIFLGSLLLLEIVKIGILRNNVKKCDFYSIGLKMYFFFSIVWKVHFETTEISQVCSFVSLYFFSILLK